MDGCVSDRLLLAQLRGTSSRTHRFQGKSLQPSGTDKGADCQTAVESKASSNG